MRLFLVAAFGALGTLARYGLQGMVQIKMNSTFPYGTLLINLTGCFFLGLIGQLLLNRVIVPPEWPGSDRNAGAHRPHAASPR